MCDISVSVFRWFMFEFLGVSSVKIRLIGWWFMVLKFSGFFSCRNRLIIWFSLCNCVCGRVMLCFMLVGFSDFCFCKVFSVCVVLML